jgi:hypothetical protein
MTKEQMFEWEIDYAGSDRGNKQTSRFTRVRAKQELLTAGVTLGIPM